MELEREDLFNLSLIQCILLGTGCVPSRVLISGIQMKKAWFFPQERQERQTCEQSVCLINKVCVCMSSSSAGWPCCCAVLLRYLLAQCQFSLSDVIQSGFHEEHEAWSRKPQESRRALCGLCREGEGEIDVASPGRYARFVTDLENLGFIQKWQSVEDSALLRSALPMFLLFKQILNYSVFSNKWN